MLVNRMLTNKNWRSNKKQYSPRQVNIHDTVQNVSRFRKFNENQTKVVQLSFADFQFMRSFYEDHPKAEGIRKFPITFREVYSKMILLWCKDKIVVLLLYTINKAWITQWQQGVIVHLGKSPSSMAVPNSINPSSRV